MAHSGVLYNYFWPTAGSPKRRGAPGSLPPTPRTLSTGLMARLETARANARSNGGAKGGPEGPCPPFEFHRHKAKCSLWITKL